MIYKNTRRFSQKIAFILSWILLFQAFLPVSSFALTSGPGQPEFNSFEPVGTTQMVDPFTGSFVYNIPLFELPGPDGGYPFNLSYKPDGNINSEAGPFGYGWTINPGIISRDVRGVPDDHNGEEIVETASIKDNWTVGADVGADIGEFLGLDVVHASAGLGLYYNSYRGVGANTSLGLTLAISENKGNNIGVGLGLDTQEGFSVSPSLSIGNIFQASTSINARRGMSGLALSYDLKVTKDVVVEDEEGEEKRHAGEATLARYGASFSLNGGANSPSLTMPWNTASVSGQVKLGASLFGLFPNAKVGGSFSLQKLKNKGKEVKRKTYGYLYSEQALNEDGDALLDFSREKDGPISDNSPNVGIPMTTPDVYMATGQGMAGMFRPYRSDIGVLHDPTMSSIGGGGSFSFDAGVLHGGGSGSLSFSTNSSGKWNNSFTNESTGYDFKPNSDPGNPAYESYYFKTRGEKIAEPVSAITDHVGGEAPIRAEVYSTGDIGNVYVGKNDATVNVAKNKRTERKPRGLVIQDYKNKEAADIPFFNAEIFQGPLGAISNLPPKSPYIHSTSEPDQIGGFTSTDTKGVRYVYGIPACNKVKESYTFSVTSGNDPCDPLVDIDLDGGKIDYKKNGTDKYYKKTEEKPFAHSYLLTSVLGSDYVDVDNNGPSVDDIGYWVKFNYAKIHDNFAWRSPYTRAFFDPGIKVRDNDDKGSFTYGEKEVWMLGTVETKTHVALFLMDDRQDGYSAPGVFNNTPDIGDSDELYKVTKIQLFTRSAWESNDPNVQPLRTVNFDYDYLISSNVPNAESGSKLTLTNVWFTSENSDRGINNKYHFDYGVDTFNPPYSATGFDRWGSYFEVVNGECGNIDFPYTKQRPDPGQTQGEFIDELTRNASVWNLKEITLPSGSTIKIDWEPHRYGYVQNRQATEMVKIHALGNLTDNILNDLTTEGGNNTATVRIYFEPEPGVTPDDYFADLPLTNAIDNTKQLYFKARTRLFQNSSPEDYQDISGYLDVADFGQESGYYYVDVKKLSIGNAGNYHPISIYGWQFMKSQLPERLLALPSMPDAAEVSDGVELVKKLATSIGTIIDFFGNFYDNCHSKQFATAIDLDNSYIKLCSPDKEKFGAGARVAKIELQDAWEANSTYGQQYTYYDGVVTNEPSIGGDENALRYGKKYTNNLLAAIDEVHFFEYPINENLYPGPSIGYGKVEVKSLATHLDEEARESGNRPAWLPEGLSTTGKVVHEFYTAKDFPVISDETKIDKPKDKTIIPAFPIGNKNEERLTVSQGFSIIKNDMHGKPKKVSNFGQDVNGEFWTEPYNYVSYNYKHRTITHNGKEVKVLDNKVNVLLDFDPVPSSTNGPFVMPQGERLIGVDYEMVNDMRANSSFVMDVGGQFNTDFFPNVIPPFAPPLIPVPSLWGSLNMSQVTTKTTATNKMIFKSGILESMEAFDGGSYVETKNLLFDPYTGDALLTQLTNEFEDDLYNLNVPGHMVYDGMGPAYENTGIEFTAGLSYDYDCFLYKLENALPANVTDHLKIGDEFSIGSDLTATYVRNIGSDLYFSAKGNFPQFPPAIFDFKLTRSGSRNQVMAKLSSVSAMSDPTKEINMDNCNAEVETGSYTDPSTLIGVLSSALEKIDLLNRLLETDSDGDGEKDFFDAEIIDTYQNTNYSDVVLTGGLRYYQYDTNNSWCDDPLNWMWADDNAAPPSSFFNFLLAVPQCETNNSVTTCHDLTGLVHVAYPEPCGAISSVPIGTIDLEFASGVETFTLQSLLRDPVFYFIDTQNAIDITTELIPVDRYNIDNVLNISAQTTKDVWQENLAAIYSPSDYDTPRNWYADKGFAYVDNRSQAGDGDVNTQVEVQTDGIVNDVALFNFQDPFFAQCTDSKWVETAKVTQYDKGNEVENKDALGIYSAALFGYENNLSTAVAQNARYSEIGYENFETYELGALANSSQFNLGSHLDFKAHSNIAYQSYELVSGKDDVIIVDHPYTDAFLNVSHVKLDIQFRDGSSQQVTASVIGGVTQQTPQGNTLMVLSYSGCEPTLANGDPFTGELWKGTVYLPKAGLSPGLSVSSGTAYVYNSSGDVPVKAHSGKQYLSLPANSTSSLQLKKTLQLEPGKEYHVSVWVARDGDKMHPDLPDMVKVNGVPLDKATDAIEGWVKLEKTFVALGDVDNVLTFHADPVTTYNTLGEEQTNNSGLYLDDLRIQPAQSSMVTYVYDPNNYRLMATLDQNNYATFYEYDHEGRLTVLKKETERGVKTIQHNQNHLADIQE